VKRIFVPTRGADDWRRCLAAPRTQWREGHSAKCLAECWEAAAGLPPEVERLFRTASFSGLQGFELLLAIPEYRVQIPGGGHPSQTDLFLLARTAFDLMTVAVEGKVAEPFGVTLGQWRHEFTRGKRKRLVYIQDVLGLRVELGDDIYYQLLHRLASAVHEAGRFGATSAGLLVHSFSPERAGFAAYREFVELFGVEGGEGELVRLGQPIESRVIGLRRKPRFSSVNRPRAWSNVICEPQ